MRGRANHVKWLLCVLFLFGVARTVAAGGAIYVDDDAAGANNGSSWENAYVYLQDALADANAFEMPVEIRVAQGIYKPDQGVIQTLGDRTATFQLINGVSLKGGYGGFSEPDPDARYIDLYRTILSGDLEGNDSPDFINNDENSFHVINGIECDETTVLDGFTIIGGNADDRDGDKDHGGGMYLENGNPTVTNCTFSCNQAIFGGAIYNKYSSLIISNCTLSSNRATSDGGGLCNIFCNPTIINCTFYKNQAYMNGGGISNLSSDPTLTNCKIIGNIAGVKDSGISKGGGMSNRGDCNTILTNCIITGNSTIGINSYAGGIYTRNSDVNSRHIFINCTFTGNSAPRGNSLFYDSYDHNKGFPNTVQLTNCIIWDSGNIIWNNDGSVIRITYSDVQGGWSGQGNINTNPLFVDAGGADNIFGTEDDDLRLLPDSPCIDAGDNTAVPASAAVDLDGNPRIINGMVDMGAYEWTPALKVFYYVDSVSGDDNNDGLIPEAAFATIQKGIDTAEDGEVILVSTGVYQEEVNFLGKAITVQGVAISLAGVPVLRNPGDFAVSFYYGEGPDSILKNFIIKNSFMGVFIADSSPTISNLTIAGNKYGIEAYAGSEPDISNTILWNNTDGDLFGCRAQYSCIERGGEGEDNITVDPLFVDPDNGDYHLRSERGRYWPEYDIWVLDKVTSPCVDGGDPDTDTLNEPMPHGGRVNIGAYGGTTEASLSPICQPLGLPGRASNPSPVDGAVDVNRDIALSWIAGVNAVSHNVYFGPNINDLLPVSIQQVTNEIKLDRLDYLTAYYWRIDEVDSEGRTITGKVWTFTTARPPKGRACFTAETDVWVSGALIPIAKVALGQSICGINTFSKIQEVQEHKGTFTCYDVLLESGNCISVAENHYFLADTGQWISLQNLKAGIKLQTPKGSIGIISITKRPKPYTGKVYNLKVVGSDRYLVGKDAVIVRDY